MTQSYLSVVMENLIICQDKTEDGKYITAHSEFPNLKIKGDTPAEVEVTVKDLIWNGMS